MIDFTNHPILYVDDERVALELFRFNFSDEFTIFTAASPFEAKEVLSRESIALILSDQRMPGMSGTDFFAEIQATHPDIIRILVTAYADLKAIVEAVNAGHIYHYIEKPWDEAELRMTLRRALEHVHLLREQKRLQEERIQTLENMARSNRLAAVGTLAAGIAHEIRNPLAAILTFHQMLPEKIVELEKVADRLPEDSRIVIKRALAEDFWTKFAHLPLREVERIRGLVQELLDFARDSGSQYPMRVVDLRDLFEEILPMIETDMRRAGVHLVREFAEDLPNVRVSSDKMKQVVINLLLNAMHASHEGGEVHLMLASKDEGKTCQVRVTDNGCGIPPEHLEKVFDPFFTTRDPGSGTGLGLTMCHHIISNHGGKLVLESEVGRGTSVWFDLPAEINPSIDVPQMISGQNEYSLEQTQFKTVPWNS